MTNELRVVLVDDHPLFQEGVAKTLSDNPDFRVVGQGACADDAVRLARDLLPDVILLDISMPGSSLDAARAIARACPEVKILMLTVSESDEDVTEALRAGAVGYILKGVGGETLVEIIRAVQRGESYVSPDLAARLLVEMRDGDPRSKDAGPLSDLTAREEQILRLVSRGLSNKEVGRELRLREKTVKHYMTGILQKLQVRNRVEAAVMAQEQLSSV